MVASILSLPDTPLLHLPAPLFSKSDMAGRLVPHSMPWLFTLAGPESMLTATIGGISWAAQPLELAVLTFLQNLIKKTHWRYPLESIKMDLYLIYPSISKNLSTLSI